MIFGTDDIPYSKRIHFIFRRTVKPIRHFLEVARRNDNDTATRDPLRMRTTDLT